MEILDVVNKLIGPVRPVGETNEDNIRFENLKVLCKLVDDLVGEIDGVSYDFMDRQEYSMHRSATYAYDFINNTLGIRE